MTPTKIDEIAGAILIQWDDLHKDFPKVIAAERLNAIRRYHREVVEPVLRGLLSVIDDDGPCTETPECPLCKKVKAARALLAGMEG